MASNGIHIDPVNCCVVVQGESLIRNLFTEKSSYTINDFSRIAHTIVKTMGHEFGVTDPGEEYEWCLGTTNDADAKLMMSFLDPAEADFVEAVQTKVDELDDVDDEPVVVPASHFSTPTRTLH